MLLEVWYETYDSGWTMIAPVTMTELYIPPLYDKQIQLDCSSTWGLNLQDRASREERLVVHGSELGLDQDSMNDLVTPLC